MAKGAPLVRFTLPIKVALEYIDFAKTNPDHRISGVEFLEGLARQRVRLLREAVLYYLGALAFAYVSLSMGDDNSILVSISPISFEAPISRALLVAGATYAFMIFCARLGFRRYLVRMHPPVRVARGAKPEEMARAAQVLADHVTAFVREHPSQWFAFG